MIRTRSRKRSFDNTASTADDIYVYFGQSNAEGMFITISSNGSGRGGADAFEASAVAIRGGTQTCVNGAQSGSAMLYDSVGTGTNWWYDDNTATWGGAWDNLVTVMAGIDTSKIRAWIDDQGESDFGTIASVGESYRLRWKAAKLVLYNRLRSDYASVPVFIRPIGSRGYAFDATKVTSIGYQKVRETQWELDNENSFIHLTPEKFNLENIDGPHFTAASYAKMGQQDARKVLSVLGYAAGSPVDGPIATAATRNGLIVDVTLSHASGATDFVPTTGIDGIFLTDGVMTTSPVGTAIEIPNASAVRTSATNIRLTLSDYPRTGPEEVFVAYNAYGHQSSLLDKTKYPVDTSASALPLRAARLTVAVTDNSLKGSISSLVFQHSAFDGESYAGSGQTWYNICQVPADGQTKGQYHAFLGSTSSSEATDPTWNASPPYFSNDGGDTFTGAVNATTFLKNMNNGQSWTYFFFGEAPATWSGTPIFAQCGGNAAGTAGFSLRYTAATNRVRLATSNGTASANLDVVGSALPTSTNLAFAVTYNASTGAYKIYINSASPSFTGTHTAAAAAQAVAGTNSSLFFNGFPSGSKIRECGMMNTIMTDGEWATIKAAMNTKHSITYS